MSEPKRTKKVVKAAEPTAEAAAAATAGRTWTPEPEAKKKATTLRIISWVLWIAAIGLEAFAIFWLLRQAPFTTAMLIWLVVILVVMGALAITGSKLWQKANRLDPASEKDKFRFFVQNQLGAIMTIIAFVPLVVLILFNKNMNGNQKAIAGIVGVVVLGLGVWQGIDAKPVSQEQYLSESTQITDITGANEVFWTPAGGVFHLCMETPYMQKEAADNTASQGTVEAAYAAGKRMPSQQTIERESKDCGFTYVEQKTAEEIQNGQTDAPAPVESDAPAPAETEAP